MSDFKGKTSPFELISNASVVMQAAHSRMENIHVSAAVGPLLGRCWYAPRAPRAGGGDSNG